MQDKWDVDPKSKKEKYKHDKGEIQKREKRNRKARKENMGWVGY